MKRLATTWPERRVLLAGGGTGGHTWPLLAVGRALQSKGAKLLWLADCGVDQITAECAETHQIPFREIPTGKWRRYLSWQNFLTPFQIWAGVRTARAMILDYRPDILFTKGGYASVPTVIAAQQLGIPIVLHESDAVMGWANRLAGRYAQKICVNFAAGRYPAALSDRIVVTGVPVAEYFLAAAGRKKIISPKLILVTGGSQGAVGLNHLIFQILPQMTQLRRVIHLTGRVSYLAASKQRSARYDPRVSVTAAEMADLMVQAELVIARASATTLAELADLGRPAILVPLPRSASQHQQKNAELWAKAGAAVVVCEQASQAAAEVLTHVTRIIHDPTLLKQMSRAASSLAQPQATELILEVLDQVIREQWIGKG